jgi:hypothetical protein
MFQRTAQFQVSENSLSWPKENVHGLKVPVQKQYFSRDVPLNW